MPLLLRRATWPTPLPTLFALVWSSCLHLRWLRSSTLLNGVSPARHACGHCPAESRHLLRGLLIVRLLLTGSSLVPSALTQPSCRRSDHRPDCRTLACVTSDCASHRTQRSAAGRSPEHAALMRWRRRLVRSLLCYQDRINPCCLLRP